MMHQACAPDEMMFKHQLLSQLDPARIPKHVAIIPDGNRRWARKVQENIPAGHCEGADNLLDIIRASKTLGIKVLTVYGFSTENWNRSPEEIRVLMWILESYLAQNCPMMQQEGIRLEVIGDTSRLPQDVVARIAVTQEATSHCDQMTFVLAVNYGGRDEIRRAFQKMLQEHEKSPINPQDVTEEQIARYLDTSPWGDPELLIRAGGELRVSNFLLWQLSYSELYVTDDLWPDFTPNHLLEALIDYQKRERRGGC